MQQAPLLLPGPPLPATMHPTPIDDERQSWFDRLKALLLLDLSIIGNDTKLQHEHEAKTLSVRQHQHQLLSPIRHMPACEQVPLPAQTWQPASVPVHVQFDFYTYLGVSMCPRGECVPSVPPCTHPSATAPHLTQALAQRRWHVARLSWPHRHSLHRSTLLDALPECTSQELQMPLHPGCSRRDWHR